MAEQVLKLVIEKGPRSGETHSFHPTNKPIRLGRVLKGNSLTIKDPSISTQHLTIEFKSNHWVITDLDSSNGTLLNSVPLSPFSPKELRDRDVVKIGEVTVITLGIGCELGGNGVEDEMKGPRRGKAVVEDSELGFGGKKGLEEGKRPRGRPKKEKVEIFAENVGTVEVVEGRGRMGTRSTRGSKKNEPENSSVDEEVGVVAEVFEKKTGRGQGRRGKERAVEGVELGLVKVEPGPGVSTRRTRSVRVVENAGKQDVEANFGGVINAEKGKKRKGDKSGDLGLEEGICSEKGSVINVQSGDGLNSGRLVVKNESRESFCEVENVENLGTDKEEREKRGYCNGSDLGQEDCAKKSIFMDRDAPDLTKMTLGDYFDYLEWALPKQIKEETELIIAEMHKKAEMYREFVREHGKDKENPM